MGRRKGIHTAEFLIVAALGAGYVYFGGLGWMSAIFCGVSPAVIALIVHFCYGLAKLSMDAWLQWVITAGCCLVTIWPEAKEAVLFVRPVFSGSSVTARGLVAAGRYFHCSPAPRSAIGTAKAPNLSALSHLLVFFLKTGSPPSPVVSLSCPSSRKATCSKPNG